MHIISLPSIIDFHNFIVLKNNWKVLNFTLPCLYWSLIILMTSYDSHLTHMEVKELFLSNASKCHETVAVYHKVAIKERVFKNLLFSWSVYNLSTLEIGSFFIHHQLGSWIPCSNAPFNCSLGISILLEHFHMIFFIQWTTIKALPMHWLAWAIVCTCSSENYFSWFSWIYVSTSELQS